MSYLNSWQKLSETQRLAIDLGIDHASREGLPFTTEDAYMILYGEPYLKDTYWVGNWKNDQKWGRTYSGPEITPELLLSSERFAPVYSYFGHLILEGKLVKDPHVSRFRRPMGWEGY